MKKRYLIVAAILAMLALPSAAQRAMDKLDRGLVAIKTTGGVYCSWRITGEEYYDVKYNIYRDGVKLNAEPLNVSNYTDNSGTTGNQYTVTAVVQGKEQSPCQAVKPLEHDYLVVPKAKRTSNDGTTDITNNFQPNDATVADVDGDGQMEILVKQINTADKVTTSDIDFDRIEVYKLDGTLLWWIDCGPNLWDFQHNETNIAAYDWDQDGKAEAIMRAADGTIIHAADGKEYVIGDKTKNYREGVYNFINKGAEYLVYMNGATGKPYSISDYPLKRLEDGETNTESAWGDGYGHRASKHFFGAPYLDGKHPSIFLARGIYTRHKMVAFDVDANTHQLKERWRWNCNTPGSAWYGEGYHNYSIADVDLDGRDEICFGSMVIDDNGKGLSTTGLGHGDAQHWGDFDPYIHGLEAFCCNETRPSNNYRDATTSKIYYRLAGGGDDGRAMCGNFTNDVPGAIALSGHDKAFSCVAAGASTKDPHVAALDGSNSISLNFRTYWDGDLLEETFNGTSLRNSNGAILKYKSGTIKTFEDTYTNNDTKATPCFQGDILGDWREEIIMRDKDNNMRIEMTTLPTPWRNYTLLHDPQYRNAMVWQMNGYNQPPHVSYFLGEMEGITAAPPAPATNGKTVVDNGGTITTSLNGKDVMLDETDNATYTVAQGAAPHAFFDNAPSWVQGHDSNSNITYTYYTHTLKGAPFTGDMRLVKLGDGALTLPSVTQTYSKTTEVWAGTLNFDGEMKNSHVWLNRFAELNSNGGKFDKGIEMNYGAILRPGGKENIGQVSTSKLSMGFGSRVVFDVNDNTKTSDKLKVDTLVIEKKDWTTGPKYLTPVFEINPTYLQGNTKLSAGTYELVEAGTIIGDVSNIVVDGINNQKASLTVENGKIYIVIADQRDASEVTWTGSTDSKWDLASSENFNVGDKADVFVTGDRVTFGDDAKTGNVVVTGEVSPQEINFVNNTLAYTLSGDAITGSCTLNKEGEGNVTISSTNTFTGDINLRSGKLFVKSLANKEGVDNGALGGVNNTIYMSGEATLSAIDNIITAQKITLADNASLGVSSGKTLTLRTAIASSGGRHYLTKTGAGALTLTAGNNLKGIYANEGTLNLADGINADSLYFGRTAKVYDSNSEGSYSTNAMHFVVPAGATASLWLDPRCTYTGSLTGEGQLTVYAAGIRNYLQGNWSKFEGTLVTGAQKRGNYTPSFDWKNGYGLPKATLQLTSGVTMNTGSYAVAIGHVTGSGTLNGTGTVTMGSLNKNINSGATFTGVRIVKVGSGYWEIKSTTPQTSLSGVNIKGGSLRLSDTNYSKLLTGSTLITVSDSGSVTGNGKVQAITLNGGSLVPGAIYTHTGYIETAGNVTVSKGTLELSITNNANTKYSRSYLVVGGKLTLNDTVKVNLTSAYSPAAGDSIVLWTAKEFAGTPNVILPTLPAGLMWDTSDLAKAEGVLKIKVPTGINSLNADGSAKRRVYTTDGRYVGNDLKGLSHGIYIVVENNRTYKLKK